MFYFLVDTFNELIRQITECSPICLDNIASGLRPKHHGKCGGLFVE